MMAREASGTKAAKAANGAKATGGSARGARSAAANATAPAGAAERVDPGSPCVLTVDVGNSATNFGLARGRDLIATWSVTTPERLTSDEALMCVASYLRVRMPAAELSDAIMSSVVPSLSGVWAEALHALTGKRPYVVGPGLKTGLELHMSSPGDLGADRVADCAAAKELYGFPLVVVDFGTATNLEVIDRAGVVQGGVIAPGLRLAARAVAEAAAQLPVIDLRAPKRVIGKNTRDAMQAGIVIGEVARIDGLIDAIWVELGYKTKVVATGEDAPAMVALSSRMEIPDEHLTLKGLALLYELNRTGRAKR